MSGAPASFLAQATKAPRPHPAPIPEAQRGSSECRGRSEPHLESTQWSHLKRRAGHRRLRGHTSSPSSPSRRRRCSKPCRSRARACTALTSAASPVLALSVTGKPEAEEIQSRRLTRCRLPRREVRARLLHAIHQGRDLSSLHIEHRQSCVPGSRKGVLHEERLAGRVRRHPGRRVPRPRRPLLPGIAFGLPRQGLSPPPTRPPRRPRSRPPLQLPTRRRMLGEPARPCPTQPA